MKVSFIRRMSQTKIKQKAKEFQNNSVRGLKKIENIQKVGSRIEILTPITEYSCKRTKLKLNLIEELSINYANFGASIYSKFSKCKNQYSAK